MLVSSLGSGAPLHSSDDAMERDGSTQNTVEREPHPAESDSSPRAERIERESDGPRPQHAFPTAAPESDRHIMKPGEALASLNARRTTTATHTPLHSDKRKKRGSKNFVFVESPESRAQREESGLAADIHRRAATSFRPKGDSVVERLRTEARRAAQLESRKIREQYEQAVKLGFGHDDPNYYEHVPLKPGVRALLWMKGRENPTK